MCGFVGSLGPAPADLTRAIATLSHRGPDDEGSLRTAAGAGFVDLGFRRLAILDLTPAGHQPMQSDDGKLALVVNGEVYNFRALRKELQARGHVFRSSSDTEVVLRAYEEFGDAFLHRLRGMFALALWDGRRQRLLLARDRLGIKPLFYAPGDTSITFASEVKALLALGAGRVLDRRALADYLRFLYVPPPRTIFSSIKKLAGGERLIFEGGKARVDRWWDLDLAPERRDRPLMVRQIRDTLREAVRLHLESDVPVGAFLSGGLDSSAIVALAAEESPRPLQTFCMAFGDGAELYDEREHAREVAARFGTEHHEIEARPDVAALLPAMVRGFDEPFGNPTALLVHELSRQTRGSVKVALAGDGGDELFLGYPRYRGAQLFALEPRALRRALAHLPVPADSLRGAHWRRRLREFLESGALPLRAAYEDWVGYFTQAEVAALTGERPSTLLPLFDAAPGGSDPDRLTYVDLKSFLPDNLLAYTDRMSMAHGLEVRVPFCDHKLVELLAGLPLRERMPPKSLLREAMAGLLPEKTLRRKKLGFNPPMALWLSRELEPMADEVRGWKGPLDLSRIRFPEGRDHSLKLWALIVLKQFFAEYRPA